MHMKISSVKWRPFCSSHIYYMSYINWYNIQSLSYLSEIIPSELNRFWDDDALASCCVWMLSPDTLLTEYKRATRLFILMEAIISSSWMTYEWQKHHEYISHTYIHRYIYYLIHLCLESITRHNICTLRGPCSPGGRIWFNWPYQCIQTKHCKYIFTFHECYSGSGDYPRKEPVMQQACPYHCVSCISSSYVVTRRLKSGFQVPCATTAR